MVLKYYVLEGFGDVYGSCAYGTSDFSSSGTCGTQSTDGSGLVNTGTAVVFGATLAATIIFVAMVIKIWRRPKKAGK
jgi:hypothetical protein